HQRESAISVAANLRTTALGRAANGFGGALLCRAGADVSAGGQNPRGEKLSAEGAILRRKHPTRELDQCRFTRPSLLLAPCATFANSPSTLRSPPVPRTQMRAACFAARNRSPRRT